MSRKRKLTIDFTNVLETIYDKIDSGNLQEYLEEWLDEIKKEETKMESTESMINLIPQLKNILGSSFEEIEDNIREGKIVDFIELIVNIFRKGIESGSIEKKIKNVIDGMNNSLNDKIIPKKRKI